MSSNFSFFCFFKIFLEDRSLFCGATDTPVLDFWKCLPQVFKPRWISHLHASLPVCNRLLWFTSDATSANLGGQHGSQSHFLHTVAEIGCQNFIEKSPAQQEIPETRIWTMSIVQNIWEFQCSDTGYWYCPAQVSLCMIDLSLPKTEHYEALSLSLVKYSVLNLFLVLAHMKFPILDHYIHMNGHRKRSI